MSFWQRIKFLFVGIGKGILEAVLPVLKKEGSEFIPIIKPFIMDIVKTAANLQMSGDDKKKYARAEFEKLLPQLKAQGKIATTSIKGCLINWVIETCWNEIEGQLNNNKVSLPTDSTAA